MSEFVPQGTVIADKYRVERPVARGGFSTVYLGVQMGLERPVALKLLDLTRDIDPTWTARFELEAKLASSLTHPNTITILDYGRSDDHLFIAMEYVHGRSLSKQIKKHGALDPLPVAQIALQICRSLEEAHSLGILHRDLKPSNIMLAKSVADEPIVKVLDFGIAKVLEPKPNIDLHLTQQGVFIGTPRYASPEQLAQEKLDARADIYGVGMVMWEALVGDPAVTELDYGACVEKHLAPKPWLLPDWISCPVRLADIVHRALQKKRENRFGSVTEFAEELSRFISENSADIDDSVEVLRRAAEPSDPTLEFVEDVVFSGIHKEVSDSESPLDEGLLFAPTRASQDLAKVEVVPTAVESERSERVDVSPPRVMELTDLKPAKKRTPIGWWMAGIVALSMLAGAVWWVTWSNQNVEASAESQVDIAQRTPELPVEAPPARVAAIDGPILFAALKTAGWTLQSGTSTVANGVKQTAVVASKGGKPVSLTVFESDNRDALVEKSASPRTGYYDIFVGRQLVRVKEQGSHSDALKSTLATIVEMGRR